MESKIELGSEPKNEDAFKCGYCSKEFQNKSSLEQHLKDKHPESGLEGGNGNKTMQKKQWRKYLLLGGAILAVIILAYTFYFRFQLPGEYDNFAKCLTEKGAVIYGNDFCSYTNKQRNWFGNSKKYLNYVKCVDNKDLCDNKGVKITPTWEINGKTYSGVYDFARLAELSGCSI